MTLRQKLGVTVVLLLGIGALVLAFRGGAKDTTDILIDGNPALEDFIPDRGDLVGLRQEVGLQVAPGWEARIVSIDDVGIPASQQDFTPALRTVIFTPGPGKVIERYEAGQLEVVALYWQTALGENDARRINWIFNPAA